ncbi:MAG: type II toxin-antitoxin system HipA family toxin [Myxococcales bacterium]|nr:type II toxin-antitoxin system HipA family toxin [Myxococcales bacterium]
MTEPRRIEVWADWLTLGKPTQVGVLMAAHSRGKEVFSFEFADDWIRSEHACELDPNLQLYAGPQYSPVTQSNFGVFLDSSPDRWGRVLMKRREAQRARAEDREEMRLRESDFLLGVHDAHRMGALRFSLDGGPFLDDDKHLAAPPWASLRELEHASQQIDRDDAEGDPDYSKWLRMLIAPGGSLGGARPKASVQDTEGHLWIAKFPSLSDEDDVGAWEGIVRSLAAKAGISVPDAQVRKFGSKHHTFLSRRFDRDKTARRLHFASAMTLLGRKDGDDADAGASYLELVELLIRQGSNIEGDLPQLWRRIVFSVCVSNTDDHLRNHGFMLGTNGWALSPAYDVNPNPDGDGLRLNISETDNSQDLELVRSVAPHFRLGSQQANQIISDVTRAVRSWRDVASEFGLPQTKQDRMKRAFRVADRS